MRVAASHWYPAYVGIGSNLDGPVRQVGIALEALCAVPDSRLIAQSALYRSAPFGGIEQPDFVNAVAALLTRLGPEALLTELQAIEHRHGRERSGARWGPRVLDLDLLVYGSAVVNTPTLQLPHPGVALRNFVLLPLRDVAPDMIIPGLGRVASLPVNDSEPLIERLA